MIYIHLRKLGLFFEIGILTHLKTLPKYWKRKKSKRIGFLGQKAHPVVAMANRFNRLGNRSTGFPCPVEVRSRETKNFLSLPVASSSRSSLTLCPVEVRSMSGRSPVEATVTCYALNAPTASDPVDPLLVRSRLLSVVFVS